MLQQNSLLWDEVQIDNLQKLLGEGFHSTIQMYFTEFETQEKALASALHHQQLDKIIPIANFLKSSSLNIGALNLAHICGQIENASKRGDAQEILSEYEKLQQSYLQTKAIFSL